MSSKVEEIIQDISQSSDVMVILLFLILINILGSIISYGMEYAYSKAMGNSDSEAAGSARSACFLGVFSLFFSFVTTNGAEHGIRFK